MPIMDTPTARALALGYVRSSHWTMRQLRAAHARAVLAVLATPPAYHNARANVARRWQAAFLLRACNHRRSLA